MEVLDQIQMQQQQQETHQNHHQIEVIESNMISLNNQCQLTNCCQVVPPDSGIQPPCNCGAAADDSDMQMSNSDRSSSYTSCTLPLKPLKGILKKKSKHLAGLAGLAMTLPRDFDVVPFDQVPPCDDCLQRARRCGSYGDVCQNLEATGVDCGFQVQLSRDASLRSLKLTPPDGFCSKHRTVSRQNSMDEKEEVEAVESSV
jgi:hypothetical protein